MSATMFDRCGGFTSVGKRLYQRKSGSFVILVDLGASMRRRPV